MCGINGILHLQTKKVDERILTKCRFSRASRTRRQRDFLEKNIGFGHDFQF
jgi:hypothetical protein